MSLIRSSNFTRDFIDYFDARLEEHSSWYHLRGSLADLNFQRPEMRENAIILNRMAYFLRTEKLIAILEGSRDPALANDPALHYMDAVELRLLLEELGSGS